MAVIEAIATTYLEADVASVTFSSIPTTYEHLQIRMHLKSDRSASDVDGLQIDFNDDANAGTLHSRLSVDLAPGVYSIQVKTVFPEESGPYVLTVSGGGGGVGPFLRGDWDANGLVQLTDGVNVFNFLFLGGGPATCLAAADANGQGVINLSSGVYVLNFLFTGGPAPIAPFPTCGPGELPSDVTLGCAEAHACE